MRVLPHYLSQPYVLEVIILDDASREPVALTVNRSQHGADPRIHVIRFDIPQHQPVLRNVGISRSRGEWIFMGEDDAFPERNHFATLIEEATAHGWMVVAGRRIDVRDGQTPDAALAWANTQEGAVIGRLLYEGYFDKLLRERCEFPFLHANALIRRDAFTIAMYDVRFADCVSYREETDFFLSLHEHGVRLGFTPATWIYHFRDGSKKRNGGIHESSWIKKEWFVWLNEIRFETKHKRFFLEQFGVLGHPVIRFPLFILRRYSVAVARRFAWKLRGR